MGTVLAIILTSVVIVSIIMITTSKRLLAPLLIALGLIGLYMALLQIDIRFFIVFLSFSLAFIASGIIIMIANVKFKTA